MNGSLRQKQVCDDLRCSGLHAHYTDMFNKFLNFLVRKDWVNFEKRVKAVLEIVEREAFGVGVDMWANPLLRYVCTVVRL